METEDQEKKRITFRKILNNIWVKWGLIITPLGATFGFFNGGFDFKKNFFPEKYQKEELQKVMRFDEGAMGIDGFMTINKSGTFNGANQKSTISYYELDSIYREFTIYINFRNDKDGIIKNAQAEIEMKKFGNDKSTTIKGYLFGDNAQEISDEVFITNLPEVGWNLRFIDGFIRIDDRKSSKGRLCSEAFPELGLPINFNIIDPYSIIIGDLPYDDHKGWCTQGYVFMRYAIDLKM